MLVPKALRIEMLHMPWNSFMWSKSIPNNSFWCMSKVVLKDGLSERNLQRWFGETEVYRLDYYQTISMRSESKSLKFVSFLNVACKMKSVLKFLNDGYCTRMSIIWSFVEIDYIIFYLQEDGKAFCGRPSVLEAHTKTGKAILCHTMIAFVSHWIAEWKLKSW